ncbi:MAG: OmpA family protein [Deltaproteobacteria bacterium]|nr:OmpA family protein [Deltaproteobacteria bacterium]
MRCSPSLAALALAAALVSPGCVTSGTHEKVLAELDQTKKELETTRNELTAELEKERKERADEKKTLDGKLAASLEAGRQLETNLASMSMKVDELMGEKGKLTATKAKLSEKQKELLAQVEELKRMRAAAESRNAEYRSLLEKLKKMMDAGTLQVKVRNGNMVVQMASDVVFAPASTRIKDEAREAILEMATSLATFENRRFLVVGHSDATPIRSARFPSNWELSSQRAVEVVKVMIEAGVRAEMLTAAGAAEFDPLVDNESPENRSTNRRVEIIFLPKIDELPGFDQVLQK